MNEIPTCRYVDEIIYYKGGGGKLSLKHDVIKILKLDAILFNICCVTNVCPLSYDFSRLDISKLFI